jgi:hypothetical protein
MKDFLCVVAPVASPRSFRVDELGELVWDDRDQCGLFGGLGVAAV